MDLIGKNSGTKREEKAQTEAKAAKPADWARVAADRLNPPLLGSSGFRQQHGLPQHEVNSTSHEEINGGTHAFKYGITTSGKPVAWCAALRAGGFTFASVIKTVFFFFTTEQVIPAMAFRDGLACMWQTKLTAPLLL